LGTHRYEGALICVHFQSMKTKPNLSLYIHVPFCRRKCRYCAFYSEDRGLERIDSWANALQQEIRLYRDSLAGYANLRTLYIGGGSPNLLRTIHFRSIYETLSKYITLDDLQEFTVEINPGETSVELLQNLVDIGVTRISVGCQSLDDRELRFLGRIHDAEQCRQTLQQLHELPLQAISADLIYGIPGQKLAAWEKSLREIADLPMQHLSLYALSYEKGTALERQLRERQIAAMQEDREWEFYARAHAVLNELGFEHYEISNWARPGFRSRHNSAYWEGRDYLGLGPSAHSHIRGERWWNVSEVDRYLQQLADRQLPVDKREKLNAANRLDESILLRLRTDGGLSKTRFEEITQRSFADFLDAIRARFGEGFFHDYAYIRNDSLQLTLKGWFVSDYLISRLADLAGGWIHDRPQSG